LSVERVSSARTLAYASVFTALVFAATLVAVEIPATRGYFNLGETMVYTAAILGGPLVGGVAGGVGSALADIYLGYGVYAPGTLVIKASEGLVVALLYYRLRRVSREKLGTYGSAAGLVAGLVIVVAGVRLLSGEATLYLGGRAVSFTIPAVLWVVVALAVALATHVLSARKDVEDAAKIFSILVGGTVMVLGYLLYEAAFIVHSLQTAAAEAPFNVGQVMVGLVVSLYLTRHVSRAM